MKKVISLLLTAMMAVTLTACSGSSNDSKPNSSEGKGDGTVDKSETLTIYSNSTQNGQDQWLYDAAKEAGFNINIVSANAGDLTNRLIAEKENGIADVIFGLNEITYEQLKAEDLLAKYEPEWADEVDMSLGDDDGYYYPIILQPLVLVYNKEFISDPPKDWVDLATDPQNKGKYNVLPLTGGTSRNIFSGIVSRYTDPKGELGISEEGWDIAKSYIQNAHISADGEDWIGNIVSGKIPMGMLWGAGVIRYQKEYNIDFGIVVPEYGVPYVCEQLAVTSTTDKHDLAVEFINWFGSAEVMKGWSDSVGAIPVHPDALAKVDSDINEFMKLVKPQEMNWELISKNIGAWMEKVELEFVE